MSINEAEIANMKALQEWMLGSLTTPRKVDSNSVSEHILPAAHISAEHSLGIYQRSYILRLRKCLAEQFPATCYALGQALFNDFADAYLSDYPSQSHSLYELGSRFALWLEENRIDKHLPNEQKEHWIDFMVDLADYENNLFRLFDAHGTEDEKIATCATPDEQLLLPPLFTLKNYRYHVAWYYHEVREGKQPLLPPQTPQTFALTRINYQTYTFPLNAFQSAFLAQLKITKSIEKSLQNVALSIQEPLEKVRFSWQNDIRDVWIDAGFFIEKPEA